MCVGGGGGEREGDYKCGGLYAAVYSILTMSAAISSSS